jgi:hypothetical protein
MAAEADCGRDPGNAGRHAAVLARLQTEVCAVLSAHPGALPGRAANALGAVRQLKVRVASADTSSLIPTHVMERDGAALRAMNLGRRLETTVSNCLKRPDDKEFRRSAFAALESDITGLLNAALESKSIIVAVMAVLGELMNRCDGQLEVIAQERRVKQARLSDFQAASRAIEEKVREAGDVQEIDLGDLDVKLHAESPMRVAGVTGDTVTLREMAAFYSQEGTASFPLVPRTQEEARSAVQSLNDVIGMEASALGQQEMIDVQTILTQKRAASEAASATVSRIGKAYEGLFAR